MGGLGSGQRINARRTVERCNSLDVRQWREQGGWPVTLATTPCHLGGVRYWFVCPGCSHRALKLGGSANMTLPFPPKPKHMHWKKYYRLANIENAALMKSLAGLRAWLDSQKKSRR